MDTWKFSPTAQLLPEQVKLIAVIDPVISVLTTAVADVADPDIESGDSMIMPISKFVEDVGYPVAEWTIDSDDTCPFALTDPVAVEHGNENAKDGYCKSIILSPQKQVEP